MADLMSNEEAAAMDVATFLRIVNEILTAAGSMKGEIHKNWIFHHGLSEWVHFQQPIAGFQRGSAHDDNDGIWVTFEYDNSKRGDFLSMQFGTADFDVSFAVMKVPKEEYSASKCEYSGRKWVKSQHHSTEISLELSRGKFEICGEKTRQIRARQTYNDVLQTDPMDVDYDEERPLADIHREIQARGFVQRLPEIFAKKAEWWW